MPIWHMTSGINMALRARGIAHAAATLTPPWSVLAGNSPPDIETVDQDALRSKSG
jgi:hypothetical protein